MVMSAKARRWSGLGALALALLALGFDMTILNVALPTLSVELHAGTSQLQWIVDAYILVFAALLLPAGLLGDRFGRKRLLLTGLALFGAASLGGSLVDGADGLIVARMFMGIGAGMVMPLSMSMLPAIFPPEERTRAVAVWSGAMALGLPLGPLLGGILLEHFWWGSIFLINVPVVVVGGIAVALLLPESRDPSVPRLDLPGAALSAGGLALLVYGVIQAPENGWTSPAVVAAITGGVVLLAALVVRESRIAQPLMDLRLFRSPAFLWGTLAGAVGTVVMSGALFVLPQYLQAVRGADAFGTGLRMIPMMAGLLVAGIAVDRLAPRVGHKPIIVAGLLLVVPGLLLGALSRSGSSYAFVATWLAITGLGTGFALVPAMDMALAGLPDDQAGRGSGLVQTIRQTSGALAVAALGSVSSAVYRHRLGSDVPHAARESIGVAAAMARKTGDAALLHSARDAYTAGMDAVLAVSAAGSLLMAFLVWRLLPRPARPDVDAPESDHEHIAS
ncbi:DHA2 family efflux MFS transporter permease subunit [Actinomadura rupiterrae]|uniref:DHA2 family efflux MFS transporter permease subunit n=1 Tax=Actinomadura rupiterrae TaxID=559627 RepID=UPI0020A5766A|nr:DHA2 family efflux MFS transporter permease subunit [Actinomadura rupiterrae]MCP2336741.1 EmrB/QacA subfamily drug resistance transporter [Actinomadura rupiterrae]